MDAVDTIADAVRHIGYRREAIVRDYAFADVLDPADTTRTVALAAFTQTPPSYRSAALAVVPAGYESTLDWVAAHRSLGAPLLFVIEGDQVTLWQVRGDAPPSVLERLLLNDVPALFERHQEEWRPQAIHRAKAIGAVNREYQLDFVDVGLMPAVEGEVHLKLDRLLNDTLTASSQAPCDNRPDTAALFRVVFRLLAAKILQDRRHPYARQWDASDIASVLRAIESYYSLPAVPGTGPRTTSPAFGAAWDCLRSGINLGAALLRREVSPYSWAFLPADASLQCSVRGDSNQASTYPRLSGGQPSLETVPNTVGLSPSGALPSGHSRGVLVRFHGQGDRPVMTLTTGFQGRRFDVPEARTGVPRIDLPSPAPCAAADAVFADAKAFLSSNEARQMSESELERELHRRGQKLVRKLLQGHHDQRSPGQVAGPAEDASGVECSARREQDSHAETTSGTMQVVGLGCARRGHGLHPLDAALNLLPERSLVDMRRRVTIATASRAPPRTPWKPQWYSTLSTWQRRCGVRCSSPSSLKACRHSARDRMVVDRRTVTLGCSCDGPQAATGRRRIDAY